jgi:hypothetical protein
MKNLHAKLFKLQTRIKAIEKDSVNPHFRNRYFDINTLIAEIKPNLNDLRILLMQPLVVLDGKPAIKTILADADSEETLETVLYLPEVTDPQKFGAAITYFRRYALTSLLLLEAEDDDGESTKPVAPVAAPAKVVTGATAKCSKCDAPMAISKASGKEYCSKLCWKNPVVAPQPSGDIPLDEIPFL